MIERIREFLRGNSLCVLATCVENRPHCSLMAYVADSRDVLYMATLITTRKYENILQNPFVSVLVDNRHLSPETRYNQALTVSGRCIPMDDADRRKDILARIVEEHPHLQELADMPDVSVVAVYPTAFLFMDGALKSFHLRLEGDASRPVNI